MVEGTSGIEKKSKDKIKPSDLRPQAQFYELVSARNPKTNKESDFLYWWNRDKKEVTIEEVDAGGMRVENSSVLKRQAKSLKEAKRKITKDVNTQREKGLEIKRHQSIDKKLFDESGVKQGMLIPYFKELIKDRDKNVNEAWQYYDAAKERAGAAKAQEKTGKVLRKSVFGPSEKAKLEKQGNNLRIALGEREKGLRFFNHYLNKRIGVDDPAESYDSQYESYVKYDRKLADIARLAQTDSLEEKDKLLKEYKDIFSKKLEVHHKLAKERGFSPVKEIPEVYPVGKKPEIKKQKLEKVAEEKVEAKIKAGKEKQTKQKVEVEAEAERKVAQNRQEEEMPVVEVEPDVVEPHGKDNEITKEVKVSKKKPKVEKVEVETPEPTFLGEIADEIKEKGEYKKELKKQELSEIFEQAVNGLVSKRYKSEGKTEVTSFNIDRNKISFKTVSTVGYPADIKMMINLSLSTTPAEGRLAQGGLEVKVEPQRPLQFRQRAKNLLSSQMIRLIRLRKPIESIIEGLNYELERINSGVQIADIKFDLKEGASEVTIKGA